MKADHRKIEDAIAAYALDSLDSESLPETVSMILEHVAGCAACRDLFRDLREVSGDLALGVEPVPVSPELEGRIMAEIRGDREQVVVPMVRRRWAGRALLAAALAGVLALGAINVQVASHLRRERANAAQTSRALSLLNDARAHRTTLKASGTTGSVSLAVAPSGEAVLVGSGLPRVPSGHVLELWLMKGGRPVPGGVFVPRDGIAIVPLKIDLHLYNAVAITVEKGAHGTTKPTTNQIFSGSLES